MKRGIFDTLRRGAENTLANWPLSAIRLAEMFVFALATVVTIFAMLVPILVSIGIRIAELSTPDQFEAAMTTLVEKWTLFVWFGAGILVLMLVFVLVHAYVEAGCARVLVDADRAAGPVVVGPRQRYRMFTMDRWLAGAKEGGWSVFWIYNGAWALAALILLIPLIPVAVLMFVFQDNPAVAAGVGCLGLLIFVLIAIVVGITTGMWTKRAIADWAAHRSSARTALATGWRAVKTDFGRHILVALAVIVIAMAASSVASSFSMFGGMGGSFRHDASFNFVMMPLQFIGSLLSFVVSAFIGNWYLASYAALAVESKP
ncbi:MAG TPA: hypothetical protein VKB93_23830 [Thermoanaerobaculia bacterium]|nr:hypothetical protein [Thermoanaerobaculia bacterium]